MLTFYVEDQNHARVRRVADDAANSFPQLARARAAAGSRVLDVVDPYADAMFNFIQLDRLIVELKELLAEESLPGAQRAKAEEVLGAPTEARELSGYLFIVGD
ncbi:hypothetical protein GCM10010435_26730 [Winogradskya consettensis]|uniref:Uncharacterized protein n=1 Tax=Winogradskya consettensis TaxID=113560 RepID=A0A919S9J0_9ACTN|nr:hypothetical protein [Actinoplanes consettensis]GIM68159.1 hypothetical protein Aco04nite_09520 [Actinoplanes consettensis]